MRRYSSLTIGCLAAFIAIVCASRAQTYQLDPNGAQVQPQTTQGQSGAQSLGWGSNIEKSRLARAAQLALRNGDYPHAVDLAQRAVQAAPNDPQMWFLLGYAARLSKKYPESVDAYSNGLRLSPSSADGLSGMAQTYHAMGRNQEAESLLKQVLSADPKQVNDALLLGDLYIRSANYSAAIEALTRAERVRPDARSELLLAVCYEHLKQFDLADQYFKAARKRAPANPDIERSLGGYLREVGRYPDSIKVLESIRNPRPDLTAEIAYTYQLAGKADDAARLYAQAANDLPNDMALQLAAAQAYASIGIFEKAQSFLARAKEIDPNHYRLHAIRAEVSSAENRIQDAVREYQLALAGLPDQPVEGPLYSIQLHLTLMELYRSERDEQAAHQQLATAQNEISHVDPQRPDRAAFLRLRALIRMNAGDLEGALNDANEAINIDSHDPNGLQIGGDVLVKLGRVEDAIAVYKKILVLSPNNRFALTSLGYASRAAGNDKAAERYFQSLAQSAPSLYVPHLALGDLYTAQRNFAAAQSSYEKAFKLSSGNALIVAGGMNAAIEAHDLDLAGTWLNRATDAMAEEPIFLREKERYLSFAGDYKGSAAVALEAKKSLPRDRDVVVYLGYDLLQLGQYDELLSLMQQNIDVFPKEPDIPLLIGYVHKHQKLQEEATRDFTEALRRDPTVKTAYVNRGYMLNDLHQPEAAASDFEAALKRDSNDGEAHLGLAYANLELNKPRAAIRHADLAERALGNSKNVHVIRATAYSREDMLTKAADEYRAALKFAPNDVDIHLSLAGTLYSQRRYRDAISELRAVEQLSLRQNAAVYALLARSYGSLGNRNETLRYVQLAEQQMQTQFAIHGATRADGVAQSAILVSTGQALSAVGDTHAAMDRFRRALEIPFGNRVSVRLAIAQTMASQDHGDEAEREIALALMEAESGAAQPPDANQYLTAADVFRSTHDYQLSQSYIQRAKLAGAPDAKVRIGLANNYLALGETTKANAELAAVRVQAGSAPDYQYLLAQANAYRQEHRNAQALTSFAEAFNASDNATTAASLLQAGADEGLRITPDVSVLGDFSIAPIFEDTTVYTLDSKLDTPFPEPGSDQSLLPPPRSSLQTQGTSAFHLHFNKVPTPSGFFQVRNARGTISVPATNSIVDRNTTDYTFNFGLNPVVHVGDNVIAFNGGVQTTIRRDSESPVQMNQNLFRLFAYGTTSSFFDAISVSGYLIREWGPFTESSLHSRNLTGAVDFRVGSPWGRNALLTGWGATDQLFTPENTENYYTSSYIGFEHRFSSRLMARAFVEDLRAWRIVGPRSATAQNLRPSVFVAFEPRRNWDLQAAAAYSNNRSLHVYDALQSSFSVSYAMPFRHKFHDDAQSVVLQYPIRFAAGLQQETFFNFSQGNNQQLRPYIQISLF